MAFLLLDGKTINVNRRTIDEGYESGIIVIVGTKLWVEEEDYCTWTEA